MLIAHFLTTSSAKDEPQGFAGWASQDCQGWQTASSNQRLENHEQFQLERSGNPDQEVNRQRSSTESLLELLKRDRFIKTYLVTFKAGSICC